ncbi:MAG: WYL domain-containing protein [Chloroflexota bacterium]
MGKRNNDRRSQWRVVHRCLDILLRAMRGPTERSVLMNIIYEDAVRDEKEITRSQADKRFEVDRERLKDWFHVDMPYNRAENTYELLDVGRPLIDLPDEAALAVAFLNDAFSGDEVPMSAEVRALLNHVTMLLPPERRRQIERERGLLDVQIEKRDDDHILADVWEKVRTSVTERRQLEFDYVSASNTDGLPRCHTVEPIRYFFDTVRKHYYLEAFWLQSQSYEGTILQDRKVQRFRLGRMSNAQVLPNHFPANQKIPRSQFKELEYVLSPDVARGGVTKHFENMQIFYREDGSALVKAESYSLFFDLRTLLHYGANCRVIGGDEAVREMAGIVNALADVYPRKA